MSDKEGVPIGPVVLSMRVVLIVTVSPMVGVILSQAVRADHEFKSWTYAASVA